MVRRTPPDLLNRQVKEEEIVAIASALTELVEEQKGSPGLAHKLGHPRVDPPALLPILGEREDVAESRLPEVLGAGKRAEAQGAILLN